MLTTTYLFLFIANLISPDLYVTDGDTIKLNGDRIRLTCIDAPEKTQPYSLEAKEHLMKLLEGKEIQVVKESTDRYGRILAWLIVEGDTINNKMVEDGFAWWYEYYCGDNKTLERLQTTAKEKKIGLWLDPNPINPYQWRKSH
jgi:endonuclease YncB( thermonuclease family)